MLRRWRVEREDGAAEVASRPGLGRFDSGDTSANVAGGANWPIPDCSSSDAFDAERVAGGGSWVNVHETPPQPPAPETTS